MDQRNQSRLGEFRLAAVGDGDFGRALQVDAAIVVGNVWVGRSSTSPPDCTPRIRAHQPYSLKARLMLAAMA